MRQGILGTTSKNPVFFIKYNNEDNTIIIYFGFGVLTVIPNNKDSIMFKSLIAILLNAGICASHIEKEFNLSYKTIKKYGNIFNSANDEELLLKDLKNPGREIYKVTDEVFLFIHERADFYKSENKTRFNKNIIQDVKNKFGLTLSRDTIRLALKKEIPDSPVNMKKDDAHNNEPNNENAIFKSGDTIPPFRNSYAGIYLLNKYISLVFSDFPNYALIKSKYSLRVIFLWLCIGVLSGMKNIERMRHINIRDFEYVSGYEGFPSIERMRESLHEISLQDNTPYKYYLIFY